MKRDSPPPHLDGSDPALAEWFDPPTQEAWRAEVARTSGGRDPDAWEAPLPGGLTARVLRWPGEPYPEPGPVGASPWVRGSAELAQAGWDVRARIDLTDVVSAGAQVSQALALGARSLWIRAKAEDVERMGGLDSALPQVLAEVDREVVPVDLDVDQPELAAPAWRSWASPAGVGATGAIAMDPLKDALAGRPWDRDRGARWLRHLADLGGSPWVHGLSVGVWNARTADPAMALGLTLAALADAARLADVEGVGPSDWWGRCLLRVPAWQDPFLTMAWLRALRGAVARLGVAVGVAPASARLFLHAVTHPAEQTRVEPWNNVLRSTGSSAGAVWGGADALTVLPRDHLVGGSPSGRRLALTSQAVLRHESHLGSVVDPGAGSAHVEHLTDALGRAGWSWMQRIEALGGLAEWAGSGGLASALSQAEAREVAQVATRRRAMVGVSRYGRADADSLSGRSDGEHRWSQPFEALRARVSRASDRPRIALVVVGPVARHKARVSFAADWFAAAGLPTEEVPLGHTLEGFAGWCVCGHDDDLRAHLDAIRALPGRPYRALAGRWEALGATEPLDGLFSHEVFRGADAVRGLQSALDALEVPR